MDKPKRLDFPMKPDIYDKLQAIKEYDNRSKQKEIEHLICCRYAEIATLQKVAERSGEESI